MIRAEQRRLKKQDRIAYAVATDGDLFRFFRMSEEGQVCILTSMDLIGDYWMLTIYIDG